MEVQIRLRNLTTNQKAAGSSPAERANESSANAVFLLRENHSEIGPNHPFVHLFETVWQAPFGAIGSPWIRTLGTLHG